MIRDRAWDREAKTEYRDACHEAWESSERQAERTDRFLAIVADGVQAHRRWAIELQREAIRMGASAILKSWKKSQRTVAVSYKGEVVTKARTIGVKRRSDDGESFDTQMLFDFTTWEELEQKRNTILHTVRSYDATIQMLDRLIALHELAPSAANPHDAALSVGVTVDEWLGLAA